LSYSLLKSDGTIFIENQLLHVPHLSYNPDLVLSDLWLFRHVKPGLADRSFAQPEELLEGVREFLDGIPADELTAIFEGWIDPRIPVIVHDGQYHIVAKWHQIN
jgi:hypothetical protein